MAITQCPDCGKDVSTMAASCPHCGYPMAPGAAAAPVHAVVAPAPVKRGTSPWTIIGWIALAFLLLILYSCMKVATREAQLADGSAPTATEASPAAPSYSVEVVSTECRSDYGRDRAEITVRNLGARIPYAKGFVQFTDGTGKTISAQDSFFDPTDIPTGSTASVTVFSGGGGAKKCGLTTIQDGDGNPVTIR